MWSVGTILTGLLSFMYDTQATTGSITTSKQVRQDTISQFQMVTRAYVCRL